MKHGWIVSMQTMQNGKWINPLLGVGMDYWTGWFTKRKDAKWWASQMNSLCKATHRKNRFVVRKPVAL